MDKPGPGNFAAYLDRVMRAAGYTKPTYFARKAGVDPSVVFRWLSGEQRPTAASLERIAPVLGVPVAELVQVAYPSPDTSPATETAAAYTDPVTGETYAGEERELWALRMLTEKERRELIYYRRARRAADEAEGGQRAGRG